MTIAEAIADTLRDSHVRLVTAVPGHGATQTYAAWQRGKEVPPPFSFHEEVAVGMVHGAALRGHRSAVLLKAHGFLKAANAVDAVLAGYTDAVIPLTDPADPSACREALDGAEARDGLAIVRARYWREEDRTH